MSSFGQNVCSRCDCRPIENRTTGLCATCAREDRKAEAAQVKEKKPINKVSAKRAVEGTIWRLTRFVRWSSVIYPAKKFTTCKGAKETN